VSAASPCWAARDLATEQADVGVPCLDIREKFVKSIEVDEGYDLPTRMTESEEPKLIGDWLNRLEVSDGHDPLPSDRSELKTVVGVMDDRLRKRQHLVPSEREKPEPEYSKECGRSSALRGLSERNDEADKREQSQEARHHDLGGG
jgi:hypothetical protein